MDIDKELEDLFNDPLLDISEKEKSLFDIPEDMQKAQARRTQPDHYAQRKVCEDFAVFQSGFLKVHQELKEGNVVLSRLQRPIVCSKVHTMWLTDNCFISPASVSK